MTTPPSRFNVNKAPEFSLQTSIDESRFARVSADSSTSVVPSANDATAVISPAPLAGAAQVVGESNVELEVNGTRRALETSISQTDDTTKPIDTMADGDDVSAPKLLSDSKIGDDEEIDQQMALYEDDEESFVARVLNRLGNYHGGVMPNVGEADGISVDPDAEESTGCKGRKRRKGKKAAPKKKLGTVLGVYFPCIQNIFGVILFIRMVWVAGTAGWLEAFCIVFMCCCCTMTTSISMSAIATNGVVSGGGPYFMISRAIGPEFGGAVGLLFYLGTTVASSMYIVGAVEILLQYMAPMGSLFGPITIPANAYNNYRVYGTALLLFMFICVFIGVKFVSKFSPIALFCVIFSILCVYIGIFMSNPERGPKICFLGDRLLASEKIKNNETGEIECNNFVNGSIYAMYCGREGVTPENDADCYYFHSHNASLRPGIPGLSSGMFAKNVWQRYTEKGNRIGLDEKGDIEKGDIICDITTSFVILIGIFFPSVTGIMAGSNRSGDLADASKSIPVGTIGAVATTSVVYMSCLLFFSACVEGQLLRDKFGESIGGGLIVAEMAWPSEWVILIGSFLSTCGAGLQSLVGAPRLLQAIATDGVIPFLNAFAVTSKKGEPRRALFLTAAIAECGVLLANVDYIAPIITMFFLMCYCFTNLACAVQTLLRTPNWRPRFRFYHWTLSVFGVCLCLALMFMSSWYYALAALALAAGIYKYIEYKGAEKEWGDGIRGLSMSAARYALLRLEEGPPHVKNWRPQLLILLKVDSEGKPMYAKLLTFSSQLKAGKGLTLVGSVLEGDFERIKDHADLVKSHISEAMKREKAKGFAEVIVAKDIGEGMSYLVQGSGVGGLRHNTVVLGWPHQWRDHDESYKSFIDTLKVASNKRLAVLIAKGLDKFPDNTDRITGTIDVWWIVHDGGLLMLLPFLLTQHKVWRRCKIRIFTVAQMEDNSIQMKKDLEMFIYQLRISAEVQVVEMLDKDISAYTYEKTLAMEQRNAMLSQIQKKLRHTDSVKIEMDTPKHAEADVKQKEADDTHRDNGNVTTERKTHFEKNMYTFSANSGRRFKQEMSNMNKPQSRNVRRMHTAVKLNEAIRERSEQAALLILNLPAPPRNDEGLESYMEYLEVLTEGLNRVLMVRGGGTEVITIYS